MHGVIRFDTKYNDELFILGIYFQNLCRGDDLLKHILRNFTDEATSSDPVPPTAEWLKIDSIILSWILTTLSKTLQARIVVEIPQTANGAWDILAEFFHDNKCARSIDLKVELHSLKLGDLSIGAYFLKIESIVTILASLGSPISNEDVVNIVPEHKNDNVYNIIIHQEPFSNLKMVRSMLTTEEMRLKSRAQTTSFDFTSSSPMALSAISVNSLCRSNVATEKVHTPCFNFNKGSCRFERIRALEQETWDLDVEIKRMNDLKASNSRSDGFNVASLFPASLIFPTSLICPAILMMMAVCDDGGGEQGCWWRRVLVSLSHRFDAFSVKDFLTRRVLLRCDSTGDLYPVTKPSTIPYAFLTSQYTWHQCLGHLRSKVLRRVLSSNSILCNKEKSPVLCHACQLGKHVRLPFVSSTTSVDSCFEIVHLDLWLSLILSLFGFK
nr:ribonuclease H-like domain-containing protein [Tanacetum cinerariifolium]